MDVIVAEGCCRGSWRRYSGTRAVASGLFAGLTLGEGDVLVARLVREEIASWLNPATIIALARHQATGDRVVILSAAAEPRLVGRPVVVRPRLGMRLVARATGWQVLG